MIERIAKINEFSRENKPIIEFDERLIRCKDCRFRNKDGECTQFDVYTSAAGDSFTPPDWFYCGYGKGKRRMTRLIDADRLKRSFEANTPIAFQDCVPGIHAIIDLEPTVDAIPIEWIWKYWDDGDKPKNYAFHIRDMIEAYKDEREEE